MKIYRLTVAVCSFIAMVAVTAGAADTNVQSKEPPTVTTGGSDLKITDEGTVIGTVSKVGPAFVDVTSLSGKTAHYVPEWKSADHGPDRSIVKFIAGLNIGDKVSVQWYLNDHLRIKNIERLK